MFILVDAGPKDHSGLESWSSLNRQIPCPETLNGRRPLLDILYRVILKRKMDRQSSASRRRKWSVKVYDRPTASSNSQTSSTGNQVHEDALPEESMRSMFLVEHLMSRMMPLIDHYGLLLLHTNTNWPRLVWESYHIKQNLSSSKQPYICCVRNKLLISDYMLNSSVHPASRLFG